MIHYGDITKINGHEVPLVDVVTGGSPCQDLSVAGKRAGLDGERSGLFMEQIRLIKEMRNASARELQLRGSDEPIRPRYMVWENVPGAFSSNQGEDFRCVLEETAKIVDKNASIPRLEGGTKWTPSGCILGNGWSIAWRVHDAQFWGVPQRRKRIALVADFGGSTAPEILFERKSLSGDIKQGRETGKGATGTIEENTSETISFQERSGKPGGAKGFSSNMSEQGPCQPSITNPSCLNPWDVQSKHIQPENGKAEALYSGECRGGGGESYVMQNTEVYGICSDNSNSMKSSNPYSGIYKAETTRTLDLNGGNPVCNQGGMIVLEGNESRDSHKGDGYKESNTMYTLNTVEQHAICIGNGQVNDAISPSEEVAKTLNCMDDPMKVVTFSDVHNALNARDGESGVHSQMLNEPENNFVVSYGLDRASFNQGKNALYDFSVEEETAQTLVARGPGGGTSETVGALCASDYKGVGNQYVSDHKVIVQDI